MEDKGEIDLALRAVRKAMTRKQFLALMGVGGLLCAGAGAGFYKYNSFKSNGKGKVVIIGGGAAGISMASRLLSYLKNPDITIIDPSDTHYYQPGFTLIASGVYSPDEVGKPQADCMPSGAKWLKDSVTFVDTQKKLVKTSKNGDVKYDFLVLAPGLKIDWNGVEGISYETLGQGDAYCIYDYNGAIKTWQGLQKFVKNGGRGIYTDTYTKHKCGGAPKKICLLSEHLFRKNSNRDKAAFEFYTASNELYDVPYFTPRLLQIYKQRGIGLNLNTRVKGIDTAAKKVHFTRSVKNPDTNKVESIDFTKDYDFLHFLPPMGAPDFVKESGLSDTEGSHASEGWAATDKETLVHKKFKDIICLGDVAGIPTSKTSAAIRKQVPIAAKNLCLIMEGKQPEFKYDGYAACPIVTDYGHVLMCEFDYDKKPKISFPLDFFFDMSHEQWVAWLLKVYVLKPMYFYGMLNGLV